MKRLALVVGLFLPWPVRRWLLNSVCGYQIAPSARIGLSWVAPEKLIMKPGSRIGHLTVVKGLNMLKLGEKATIGRGNWITAYPLAAKKHFSHVAGRNPALILGDHAAITSRHLLDCTDCITIGEYTTVAGFRSQLITHTIDLQTSRQTCAPISVGKYCFIGTNCVLLGGSELPAYCVLGASSLLREKFTSSYQLYGGVPARPTKALDSSVAYFRREEGFVH